MNNVMFGSMTKAQINIEIAVISQPDVDLQDLILEHCNIIKKRMV